MHHLQARLLCTYGDVAITPDAARWELPGEREDPGGAMWSRLGAGDWRALRVSRWHAVRNAGDGPASWLYVMR